MNTGTEYAHQAALFSWAKAAQCKHPELRWLHHIPNGVGLGSSPQSRSIRGSRIVAQGVKKGVADICLPVRTKTHCGLYIELKRPSIRPKSPSAAGGVTEEQKAFGEFVTAQGYLWVVAYSWVDSKNVILNYLRNGD